MSPTGTGEGSQVFFMMFGLNTVLVKTTVRWITLLERNFSFEQPKHFLMTLDNQGKLGLPWVYQINCRHIGFTRELWVNAISRF
jgi:hypothetical protein